MNINVSQNCASGSSLKKASEQRSRLLDYYDPMHVTNIKRAILTSVFETSTCTFVNGHFSNISRTTYRAGSRVRRIVSKPHSTRAHRHVTPNGGNICHSRRRSAPSNRMTLPNYITDLYDCNSTLSALRIWNRDGRIVGWYVAVEKKLSYHVLQPIMRWIFMYS